MTRPTALLVAESGGHLDQLTRLEPRLRPVFDRTIYVTSPTDQSQALLEGRDVRFVRRVPPRAGLRALAALGPALRMIRRERVTDVVSTGSAIAVPYLLAARMLGVRAHYIESAARTDGPSLTGTMLQRVPGVHLYTQYPTWADETWTYQGSVFDGFTTTAPAREDQRLDNVVVTLGTMHQYPFDRAVQAIRRVVLPHAHPGTQILWQVGEAETEGLHGDVQVSVPLTDLRRAIADADLVVTHAGTGSSLQILDAGRVPLLLPRSVDHGEHVDDHQSLIAGELSSRGLAVVADPDELEPGHVEAVLERRVSKDHDAAHFQLKTSGERRLAHARSAG